MNHNDLFRELQQGGIKERKHDRDCSVSDGKVERVLAALAYLGNKEVIVYQPSKRVQELSGVASGTVSKAMDRLQSLGHIDVEAVGSGSNVKLAIFVRYAAWNEGKTTSHHHAKKSKGGTGRVYGHPFRYPRSGSVEDVDVKRVFDALHNMTAFRETRKQDAPNMTVIGKSLGDILAHPKCHDLKTVQYSLDILNTWGYAKRTVEEGETSPRYILERFAGGGPFFDYETHKDIPDLPDPGYLGDIEKPTRQADLVRTPLGDLLEPQIGTGLERPEPPAVPWRTAHVPTDAPGGTEAGATGNTGVKVVEPRVDVPVGPGIREVFSDREIPVLNPDNPPSLIWDPKKTSTFMLDLHDYGPEAAILLDRIKVMTGQYPSHPMDSTVAWVKGPSPFPGNFRGLFPWPDHQTITIIESMTKAGRLDIVSIPSGTFYRVNDRRDVLP